LLDGLFPIFKNINPLAGSKLIAKCRTGQNVFDSDGNDRQFVLTRESDLFFISSELLALAENTRTMSGALQIACTIAS